MIFGRVQSWRDYFPTRELGWALGMFSRISLLVKDSGIRKLNTPVIVVLSHHGPKAALMAQSETVEPLRGRHEGAAVKMRVPTLGSVRRPVASAPAPGAVGTWTRIL